MDLLQIFLLAVVQGVTEFLPISSSAHLILAPRVLGYADQGLAFDVAVHVGTLLAVIGYFRAELTRMLGALVLSMGRERRPTPESRLALGILLATVPVAVAGLAFKTFVENDLRTPLVIAVTTIGFGILLYAIDSRGRKARDEYSLGWREMLLIGLFQAIAIVPGTSRSGITITAGLMLGLSRRAASRFSFLLAIPTIGLSGAYVTLQLLLSDEPVAWMSLLLGSILAFVTAYLCIHFFLRFIERIGMLPFVIYRLVLGGLILVWFEAI
jgi:undecaprenyl-diphosphatase